MTTASSERSLFELDGVSFAIGGKTLLEPLSLKLPAGRIVGLIGQNGSGKSTLLKIMARQQPATAGRPFFLGRPLVKWNDREFARSLAYLPQNTPAAAGLRVEELVALGRYPWHGALGRFGEADRKATDDAMALAGLRPFAGRLVDTLSGGERQRAWLGMLVAQDTACLLLDEPIAALDIAHQVEILGLIQHLARQKGQGVLIVLHDINMAARFCDEIIALRSGRLVARGTPPEILTPETLERIYGVAMAIIPHPRSGHPVALPC